MNTITPQVSQGNSHMRYWIGLPSATRRLRMRSCEMAITRYTSRAMAPELAMRKPNTWAGTVVGDHGAKAAAVDSSTATTGVPALLVMRAQAGASPRLLSETACARRCTATSSGSWSPRSAPPRRSAPWRGDAQHFQHRHVGAIGGQRGSVHGTRATTMKIDRM
jgi:hypothetical protein